MNTSLESDRVAVLARYGAAAGGRRWVPVGGGFSGAAVWQGRDDDGPPILALKAWPANGMTPDRLERIHGWVARASHLPFVPAVLPTRSGSTTPSEAGRVWELTRWMPGVADFHANPTPARLANACAALAQLHRAWEPPLAVPAPCPAVARRRAILAEWDWLRSHGKPPVFLGHAELNEAVRRAMEVVGHRVEPARRVLLPWADRPVAVQPCLSDVWHDHVLFTGDQVTGIIDYGAMKPDHVAVDLARLLGDCVGDDDAAFAAGLHAYHAAGGRLDLPAAFVRLLDRTGVLCGAIVWLLRLVREGRRYPDAAPVAHRLNRLLNRLVASPQF